MLELNKETNMLKTNGFNKIANKFVHIRHKTKQSNNFQQAEKHFKQFQLAKWKYMAITILKKALVQQIATTNICFTNFKFPTKLFHKLG
jgi:hypothetical protein